MRIEERPVPSIGKGEILLKTRAASICGSDVMEWYRVGKGPRILGHEITGEIAAVGKGVTEFKVGDRVAASHHVPCFHCHYCELGHHTLCDTLKKTNFDPGGFAELIRLPEVNVRYGVYPLSDDVSFEEGTLIEPLACVVRAQEKAQVRSGQTVLVLGSGMAGLLHIQISKLKGAKRVFATDINEFRLKVAKAFGADDAWSASEDIAARLTQSNEGRLADAVIVCVGSRAVAEQALELVGRGGTILFFALAGPDQVIPLAMNKVFWEQGATLMSSYAASPDDHRKALELIRARKIDPQKMISHRLGFSEVAKGFELVAEAQDSLKVIIDPTR